MIVDVPGESLKVEHYISNEKAQEPEDAPLALCCDPVLSVGTHYAVP